MARLVVGLGNPGQGYARNRHNVGFMVVDELVRRCSGSLRGKFHGQTTKVRIGDEDVLLLQPMTYMNESGVSVAAAASFYKAEVADTIVVHDELDLPFGEIRVKDGGGHGGHNGLRSIFTHFGRDFVRIRFGIGRPPHDGDATPYVLGDFDAIQRQEIPDFICEAADAVECVLGHGAGYAMNALHSKATTH